MTSLEDSLRGLVGREVAAWLNHHDLKVLTGRLTEVAGEHIVIKVGEQSYFISTGAIVAVRPSQ